MTTHLYLFTIGPVQAFIAQARRTQDLYMGSRMLSALAAAGVRAAAESAGFKAIFPAPSEGADRFTDDELKKLEGVPHRFAFLSDEPQPPALAQRIEDAIRNEWRTKFASKVRDWLHREIGGGEWQEVFDAQAYDWLEFYWVALPYNESQHADVYRRANAAMAQRKYARHFPQIEGKGDKCTLTGIQAALPLTEAQRERLTARVSDIVIRSNERLGALATIKRLADRAECFDKKFEVRSTRAIARDLEYEPEEREDADAERSKEVTGYLAVLHMDGDGMGKHLSSLTKREEHAAFSGRLSRFAQCVPEVIKKHGGKGGLLVYSGGDDVLALLPLRHVLKCAEALYKTFHEMTDLTASAGIAITPYNLPLDSALALARKAEEEAKETYGRDALVFTEAHGTGQLRSAGAKWQIVPFLQRLQALFAKKKISSKLGYELQTIDHDLHAADMAALRAAEILRVARRRTAEGVRFEEEVEPTIREMIDLVEKERLLSWADMANWAILMRFLASDASEGR
ncbi:MAG: type III-B CRISPR-associated protein Cas10/Cmr2 [Chloroflexi bacterium]|nr:type III-B CRISPR-associated protein Cas10/Cmr2 [Chloroflexota bacterium]